jgi:hypothetical protein
MADVAADFLERNANNRMAGCEALVHLRAELATKAIDPLERSRHAFRHGPNVMSKILGHHIEMTASLCGGVPHFLAETPKSLVEVRAGLGVHGATLALRPRSFQACRVGYSPGYM